MAAKSARALYCNRKTTAEPVFGMIKEVLGFHRFHLRGLAKVDTEWHLLSLGYNFKRLFQPLEGRRLWRPLPGLVSETGRLPA